MNKMQCWYLKTFYIVSGRNGKRREVNPDGCSGIGTDRAECGGYSRRYD